MVTLNDADKLYIGGVLASAAYVGATKVWPIWKPTKLAGCVVWLDASKSYWSNLGSSVQPTVLGAPAPVFRTNPLSGLPVMRITRGQGRLRFTGLAVDKDYTVIYVGRKWQTTIGRVVTALDTSANILFGYHGMEGDVAYIEGWMTSPSSPPGTAQWKLYSADSTSAAPARFFINGALNASGTVTPAKGLGGTLCISGYTNSEDLAVSQQADCEIAELVVYNRKLPDAERQQVENYLRTKHMSAVLWKPTDLGADLTGWFDSSDVASVQLAGSGVNNWVNRGVGALTVSQGTDAYRPTYLSAGGVNFATAQGMLAANSPASYDLVVVARPNPPGPSPVNWRTMLRSSIGNPIDSHQIIIEDGTTRLGAYYGGFQPAGGLTWGSVDGLAYGRFSNAALAMLSRDGGDLTSMGVTIASTPFVAFGSYQGPPPSQGFGLVKEIVFVPYNSPDRQKLEGYAAHKWGLDPLLPAGHPYKTTPP